jgi:hypothetical protein
MNELAEFLKKNKNKKLSYAFTGWEVHICDIEDDDNTIFMTDIHSILHNTMNDYGIEDHSP